MHNTRGHLADILKTLPGIGSKQAERFVHTIVEKGPAFAQDFAYTLQQIHSRVKLCPVSFQYFETEDADITLSPIVRDTSRDHTILMIVEKESDIDHIEKSRVYNGQYFVLGGTIPMIHTRTRSSIRINEMQSHIEHKISNETLSEIILGFSFTPESEHTRLYIESLLSGIVPSSITVSMLGRGLSVGSEIEYSDPATIAHALEHRILFSK